MRRFPRRFANDVNFASGAKSGSSVKVPPGASFSQGVIPGATPNFGAEHLNDLLEKIIETQRRQWIVPFLKWESLTFDAEPGSVAGVNEGTIMRMAVGNDAALFYHGSIATNDQITADDNVHTDTVDSVIETPGYVYWIEPALTTIQIAREWDRSDLASGSTARDLAGSDSSVCRGAYDADNDAVVIVQDGLNGYRSPPGGGNFSTAAGSTLTTPDPDLRVAAGGGVVIAQANNTAMIRSTDGGQNWVSDVTEIATVGRFHGIHYDAPRSRFLAIVRHDSNTHAIYESTNGGVAWSPVETTLAAKGVPSADDDYVTFLSDDVLMICPDSETTIETFVVYDLGSGESWRLSCPDEGTLTWGFDGVYLWCDNGSVVFRSNPINELPKYDVNGLLAESTGS